MNEELKSITRFFDRVANQIQTSNELDYQVVCSALVSTAVSAVIANEGEQEAAKWLREIANNLEQTQPPKH